ncbi:unnamed protein product, partial [Vitis vinifera]
MATRPTRITTRRAPPKFLFLLLLILVPICVIGIFTHGQKISYFFRPLWDNPPPPFIRVPHYYAENVSMDHLCRLHGWSLRSEPRRVFDAIIFSNELDMLEVRWRELHPYVSKFIFPFYFVATVEAMNLVGIYTILFCARMFPKSCEINGYFLRS